MNRISTYLWIVSVLSFVIVGPVASTQIEYVSPREMGKESSLVVRGEVAGTRSYWNEGHTKIMSETVVRVDETYKGQPGTSVRILQLGGVVGTLRMDVHGALTWRPGEEVLLFLDPLGGDGYRVAGFSQGKFKVERDPITGEPFVKRPALDGAEVLGAPGQRTDFRMQQTRRVPLDAFVRDALEQK